jgi:hypothetical protein
MFEIKKLDDARIQDPLIKVFVDAKLTQLYPNTESIGLDTEVIFIESLQDLKVLGVFEDDGLFIDVIEHHSSFHCFEVYLESDTLLIVPDTIGVNDLFNEVLSNAYSN